MTRGTATDVEWPPGIVVTFGKPHEASEFVQAKLPGTMKFESKHSRSVSFQTGDADSFKGTRGTTRSRKQAVQVAASWCWTWWQQLSAEEQAAVQTAWNRKRGVTETETADQSSSSSKKSKH